MKFSPAPVLNESLYERYLSENGVWEMGLYKVNFGTRIRVGTVADLSIAIDACAGADSMAIVKMLFATMKWMEARPETIAWGEVFRTYPRQEYRPYENDPRFVKFIEDIIENGCVYNTSQPLKLNKNGYILE